MARTFKSIGDVSSFIKNKCYEQILNEVGKEAEIVMKEITENQVKGDTGDIIDCIGVSEQRGDSVTIAWKDEGNWFSLHDETFGEHMYAPWALENGFTFDIGKPMFMGYYHPKTTLAKTSAEEMKDKSVDIARRILSRNGFKV